MSRYLDYIKRGEFLMAPYLSYKSQYILKCCECEKYFDQLESLFSHCMGHYQNENNGKEWSLDEVNNGKTGDMKRTSLKYENITETEGEDPLNSLEGDSTPGKASLFVKEEPKYGSYQMDQIEHDEYEPVEDLTDVPDDTNSETVESSVEDPLTSMEWDCTPESASHIVKEEPKYGSYQMDQIEHDEYEPVEELTDVPDDTNSETVESNVVAMENKCFKSDSFVRDFMKSKLNVTTLIAAYKEQPKLWNNNIPNIRTEERNRILNDISKELRKEVNVNFSYAQVAAIIAHMRYTYRVKMKRMQTTDQHVAQTWYFEHLSFLKPFLEKISTAAGNSLQPDLPRKHLTQILDIYKRHPHLWNTDLAENCCENKRTEAFEEMLIDIESEIHLKINQNTLKEYIESIRNCVAKLKHRDMINSKKETSKAPEYYTHMKFLYNHVGPFKCSECGRKPKNALAFKVHKSQHDGSMPLICSLCNKKFKLIITYKSHVKRHMEDLKVGCKECGKRFVNSYNLKIHMRCHTGAKPFCCEICGSSFRHIQTFTSHKRRHEKKFMHNCPICSKGFYTKGKHDDHVRSHKNIREFECKTCGKAFKTKKTLLQHEVTHDDARKHACTLCGKTFKLKVGVIQHMKTHGSTVDKNTAIE